MLFPRLNPEFTGSKKGITNPLTYSFENWSARRTRNEIIITFNLNQCPSVKQ